MGGTPAGPMGRASKVPSCDADGRSVLCRSLPSGSLPSGCVYSLNAAGVGRLGTPRASTLCDPLSTHNCSGCTSHGLLSVLPVRCVVCADTCQFRFLSAVSCRPVPRRFPRRSNAACRHAAVFLSLACDMFLHLNLHLLSIVLVVLPFVSSVQFARRDCSENLLYMDSRLRQDAQDPWLQTQRKHTRNRRAGKGRNRLAPSKRCTAVYGQDFSQ